MILSLLAILFETGKCDKIKTCKKKSLTDNLLWLLNCTEQWVYCWRIAQTIIGSELEIIHGDSILPHAVGIRRVGKPPAHPEAGSCSSPEPVYSTPTEQPCCLIRLMTVLGSGEMADELCINAGMCLWQIWGKGGKREQGREKQ